MPKYAQNFLRACMLSLLVACPLFAQAVIDLVGYSPQQVLELNLTTQRSMPLSVIGVGQPVYLRSLNAGSAYAWSLSGPGGSSASLSSNSAREVYFKPDVQGAFTVSLTHTSTSGAVTTREMKITAASYIGVGNIGGRSPSFPQCALCHADVAHKWAETKHATTLERGISGTLSSHFRSSCVECHSTGYDTLAVNGGFDDLAKTAGWTFPQTLDPAQWDNLVTGHPNLAQLANVQCESCHGPGSEHRGDITKTAVSYDAGVCAYCHESGARHYFPTQWRNSGHGLEIGAGESFNRAGNTCVPCHTAEGFFEVNVKSTHLASAPYENPHGVTCQVCHDPHEKGSEHQLRVAEDYLSRDSEGVAKYKTDGTAAHACDICHHLRPGTDQPGGRLHYSHQTDMLNGTVGYRYPGKTYPRGLHGRFVEKRCAGCHMHVAADEKRNHVGGHTFAMHATVTDSTGSSREMYLTEACTDCHADIGGNFDYRGSQTRVTQLLNQLKARLPLSGSGMPLYLTADYNAGRLTEAQMKAAFNWYVVYNDGSKGVHNPLLAIALLEHALDDLGGPDTRTCDLSGDGKSDMGDVIFFLLLRHADPNDPRLDYNGDGVSDIADAIALLADIRGRTCMSGGTLLAADGGEDAEPITGLSAVEIEYVEGMMAILNLTPDEQAEFMTVLHGTGAPAGLPRAFELAQNAPNPFNPATTISYSVPEGRAGVDVRIDVFDIRGRIVATLVDGTRDAGTYTVFWSGTDRDGRQVSSGVYFYRMRAGDFVQTRKMVVLK